MNYSLHHCARDEEEGQDVAARVAALLAAGADPHAVDENGETAFNAAAANALVTGRLITLHWLYLALEGMGPKGLNDRSGAHGSTLAQYIAKWLHDDEIESALAAAVAKGMVIDAPNKSGWTPLTAAAAMGRVRAVETFLKHYSPAAVRLKTTEEYKTAYNGHPVVYTAGLDAAGVAEARLAQDKGLSAFQKQGLQQCIDIILIHG